ncbi:non-structural protein [Yacaaba virus]|uniref:Non-structural protein NS-S n=1 Tax=Yacaaba virus TaxID=1819307 RepID=A0A142J8G2_9VIRU|nr:nonstructural protein [Yacaaba virus]WMC17282.1 non-structural protein [Yacaaba virus]
MNLSSLISTPDLQVGLIQIRGMLNFCAIIGRRSISLPLGISFSALRELKQVSRSDQTNRCVYVLKIGRLTYIITIFLQTGTTSLVIQTSPYTGSPATCLGIFCLSTKMGALTLENSLNDLL